MGNESPQHPVRPEVSEVPAATPPGTTLTAEAVLRRLGPAGPLALISLILPALGGFLLLGTLNVVGPWLRSHQELGIAIYITGFAVCAGLAVLPTYAQAILGGWAFGFAVGFPAALAGFGAAALIGYVIARRAAGDRVITLLNENPKMRAVYHALLGSGYGRTLFIVTLLRVPPNSPFALTNLVLASTRVPLSIYLIGTLVGMAPRTAVAVFLAAGLKELSFERPHQTWIYVVSVAALVVVVAIIGQIANRAVARVTAMQGR